MKNLLLCILFYLTLTSCKKEKIDIITETPIECAIDTTQGNYHVVAVTYVDSTGGETNYYPTNLDLSISTDTITITQNMSSVEEFFYTTSSFTDSTNYYNIASTYGVPCNNYKLQLTPTSTYLLSLPTNNVGCYRVFKIYKL